MANINLLPWREELREEKKKEFYTWLIAAVLCAAVLFLLWNGALAKSISNQQAQNQYVQAEIDKLTEKAQLLDELKKNRAALLERVEVIQELQGKRPKIVHVFDELTRLVPEGVFLTEVVRTDEQLAVKGAANNNNDVSDFMRRLASSGWFAEPVLQLVKANPALGEQANDFQLLVGISNLDANVANKSKNAVFEIPNDAGVVLTEVASTETTSNSIDSVDGGTQDSIPSPQAIAEQIKIQQAQEQALEVETPSTVENNTEQQNAVLEDGTEIPTNKQKNIQSMQMTQPAEAN